MAGVAGSHKDLWQFITGTGLQRPEKAIEEEIKRNKEKLLHGLAFYKKQRTPSGEALKKEKKLDVLTFDFVVKLGKFLGLDELQTHSIFCSYLQHDYRGSQKDLNTVLKVERHAQALIVKVRDYYFSERLYLLHCIKHLFSYWQDPSHSYRKQYADFVEAACDNDKFIKEARDLYESLCEEVAPTWETHGNLMNEKQAAVWLLQNLREQCELLEILLLFYKDFQHPAESLQRLLAHFKRQGFGRRQTNKHLLDERAEPLLYRIGYLEVLIVVEAVDLEDLQMCQEKNSVKQHPLIESPLFKDINALMCSLVENTNPQVGPILLMWSVVRFLALEDQEAHITQRLGNAALQKRAFHYLADMLNTEPFNGKTTVAAVTQSVLYGLISLVLGIFHEDTLGDTQALYSLAAKLLAQPLISDVFWHKGTSGGTGSLLQSAICQFPLDFNPLLSLSTALASANKRSAIKMQIGIFDKFYKLGGLTTHLGRMIVRELEQLPSYTEYLDKNSTYDVDSVGDATWQLMRDKRPYQSDHLIIRKGTLGQQLAYPGSVTLRDSPIIQWEFSYNTLNLFWCEVNQLLEQVAHGARMVSVETVRRVSGIARLMTAVLTSAPIALDHVEHITNLFGEVLQRFCLLNPPDLDLLSSCVEALTCVAKQQPKKVWHCIQQTGLLPFLTENFSDLTEATSGAGLNAGAYGGILAGAECPSGSFPLTLAFLELVSTLVQLLHEAKCLEELTASVLFISREIFPVFHKWRYAQFGKRELLGQKCLQVFHKILNILAPDSPENKSELALRDVVVHSLLYSESGRSLLTVISTGVDRVEMALAMQGSAVEGVGIEMIRLIRLAFSVLNRLLLLRPLDSPLSPVEHSLSAQPANGTSRHVVATIAQYIYHHHDPKLTTLATLLLKRLAMVFPMSLLACLGNEAEAIRDVYLARLQAATQDIRLKVVILELLAVCVETQPGLTELFLNVQPAKEGAGKDLLLGRTSCLQTALSLMEENKQGTYQCPSDLLCATLEFVHALWHGRRETAMAVLREKPTFWRSVCLSLVRDLPQPNEMEVDQEVLEREIKTCAYIMKILAVELHCVQSDKLDENLQKVLKEVVAEKRFEYWSAYLRENLKCTAEISELPMEVLSENCTLKLLIAWRNLVLVLSSQRIDAVALTSAVKDTMIQDILDGLQALFSNGMTALHIKLSSVASAFVFTLLQHWKRYIRDWSAIVQQLESVLTQTCANSETLIPPVQIGILGSLTSVLQHIKEEEIRDIDQSVLGQLAHVVCSVLQQSTYQLLTPNQKQDATQPGHPVQDIKLKLQILNVCLLKELVHLLDSVDAWLPILKQHFILPCLLTSIQIWMESKQGMQYIEAVLMLFITLAKVAPAAEALALNGLTKHTCLVLSSLYPTDSVLPTVSVTPTKVKSNKESPAESLTWVGIYRIGLSLVATMLRTLRYNFLEDGLNFVGVHQDRMFQCLESVKINLTMPCLQEAEETCRFLGELSHYRREWRLHLPEVLNKLVLSLCYLSQTCISLLIRPRLLHHMLEKQSGQRSNKPVPIEKLTMTPITRRLSQQSSSEDGDSHSTEVMETQHRLLLILSQCLAAMRQFSPDLCEILLDQSMDVGEYEPILAIGFSTPSLEQETPPSFGTLVSGTNLCIRLLAKLDPRPTSPVKSPDPDSIPVKRPVVMFVLENTLQLIMSQAMRYLREPGLAARDKQLLKRELRSELNTFLMSMQRHLSRRGAPPSPAAGTSQQTSPQGLSKTLSQSSFASSQEQAFFKLIDNFVKNILR